MAGELSELGQWTLVSPNLVMMLRCDVSCVVQHWTDPHQGEALVTMMSMMWVTMVTSVTPLTMLKVRNAQPKLGGHRGQTVGEDEGRGALLLKRRKC